MSIEELCNDIFEQVGLFTKGKGNIIEIDYEKGKLVVLVDYESIKRYSSLFHPFGECQRKITDRCKQLMEACKEMSGEEPLYLHLSLDVNSGKMDLQTDYRVRDNMDLHF
jgi:hypothetical protein